MTNEREFIIAILKVLRLKVSETSSKHRDN